MYKAEAITFGRLHTWTLAFHYRKDTDLLTIKAPWPQEGVWVDLPDNVRVLVDPQTGEAVEFQIMAFNGHFLAKRPDLAALWGQVKPSPIALRRMENTPFIPRFLEHIEQLANERAQQLRPSEL